LAADDITFRNQHDAFQRGWWSGLRRPRPDDPTAVSRTDFVDTTLQSAYLELASLVRFDRRKPTSLVPYRHFASGHRGSVRINKGTGQSPTLC